MIYDMVQLGERSQEGKAWNAVSTPSVVNAAMGFANMLSGAAFQPKPSQLRMKR
jgi:hypothetical protein